MAPSPRERRNLRLWRRSRHQSATAARVPWGWIWFTGLVYAAAGTIMAVLPAPYWVWNLALVGAIAQALALAGPRALSRFRIWSANVLALVAIAGAGAVAAAIAIALGFIGPGNLDEVQVTAAVLQLVSTSLLAIALAALGAILGAGTGDRLLRNFGRLRTSLTLAATCIVGLGLGGVIGLLVKA